MSQTQLCLKVWHTYSLERHRPNIITYVIHVIYIISIIRNRELVICTYTKAEYAVASV